MNAKPTSIIRHTLHAYCSGEGASYTVQLATPYRNIIKAEWRSASPNSAGLTLSISELNSSKFSHGAYYFAVISNTYNARPFNDVYPLNKVNLNQLSVRWLNPDGSLAQGITSGNMSFELDLWEDTSY